MVTQGPLTYNTSAAKVSRLPPFKISGLWPIRPIQSCFPAIFRNWGKKALRQGITVLHPNNEEKLLLKPRKLPLTRARKRPSRSVQRNTRFPRYVELELSGDTAPLAEALQSERAEPVPLLTATFRGGRCVRLCPGPRNRSVVVRAWRLERVCFAVALASYDLVGEPLRIG